MAWHFRGCFCAAKQHAETEAIIGQSRGSGGRTVVLDGDRVVPNFALPIKFFRPEGNARAQDLYKCEARPANTFEDQIGEASGRRKIRGRRN